MIQIDINMPSGCAKCPCYEKSLYGKCNLKKEWLSVQDNEKRPEWCPMKETIQCKDCKNFDEKNHGCIHLGVTSSGNGYCSDGRKKENDEARI